MLSDYYGYISLGAFVLFAVFLPLSLLIGSKLIRSRKPSNSVKNAPYESAEAPIGRSRDVENEYVSFFALFLPAEVLGVMALLWAVSARQLGAFDNLSFISLVILASVVLLLGYKATGV